MVQYAPCDTELVVEILEDESIPAGIIQMSEIYSVGPAEDVPEYCFASNILMTIKYDENINKKGTFYENLKSSNFF